MIVKEVSIKSVNTDHATAGVGEDVGIGQEPESTNDRIWVLDAIQYSYDSEIVKGGIIVFVGDKVKLNLDISTTNGSFNLYIPGQADKVISVLLKGSDGCVGKLNVQWHLEPAQG